jgi:uncharacterized membrane protein
MAAKDGLLTNGAKTLASAVGKSLLSSATDKIGGATERLTDFAGGGAGGLISAFTGKGGGGGGGSKNKGLKLTNIVESIDVGVPVRTAYDLWTQFADFPNFMKKVETVEQEEDEKLHWKAQILWSHREWDSTITEQIPDRRIVWRSEGAKGYVDGAITFHELGPELTRILMVLEYHPQGFFEHTGNIWRAQGRRARLELKHFQRYAMTEAVLHPDEIEGWRGEIHDGEVTKDNETARSEEEEQQQQQQQQPDRSRSGAEHERHNGGPRRERRRDEPRAAARRSSDEDDRSTRRPTRRHDDQRQAARSSRG